MTINLNLTNINPGGNFGSPPADPPRTPANKAQTFSWFDDSATPNETLLALSKEINTVFVDREYLVFQAGNYNSAAQIRHPVGASPGVNVILHNNESTPEWVEFNVTGNNHIPGVGGAFNASNAAHVVVVEPFADSYVGNSGQIVSGDTIRFFSLSQPKFGTTGWACYRILKGSPALITGDVAGLPHTFEDLFDAYVAYVVGLTPLFQKISETPQLKSLGDQYIGWLGWTIGDGGTTDTEFTAENVVIATHPTQSVAGGNVAFHKKNTTLYRVNLGASDAINFSVGTFYGIFLNSDPSYDFEAVGSPLGELNFSFWIFTQANQVLLNCGDYLSCLFLGCRRVEVNSAISLSSCVVAQSPSGSDGFVFVGDPGIYTYDMFFDSNQSTADLTIDPSGPGTYTFNNISVLDGYTLKIRNASATHAITVAIPTAVGISSTSTAGGAINIVSPQPTLTLTNLVAGSRVYVQNTTDEVELFNEVEATTTWSETVPSGKALLIRVRNASGTPKYKPFQTTTGALTSDTSIVINQELDE